MWSVTFWIMCGEEMFPTCIGVTDNLGPYPTEQACNDRVNQHVKETAVRLKARITGQWTCEPEGDLL